MKLFFASGRMLYIRINVGMRYEYLLRMVVGPLKKYPYYAYTYRSTVEIVVAELLMVVKPFSASISVDNRDEKVVYRDCCVTA